MVLRAVCLGLGLAGAAADDAADLAKAVKKTGQLQSYKFKMEMEAEFAGSAINIPLVEGFFKKEDGMYVKVGDRFEAARKGDRIVYADQDGTWKHATAGARERGFDFRQIAKTFRAPHDMMEGIEKKIEKLAKEEKTERVDGSECAVYSGTLTQDAAKSLMPLGDHLAGRAGGQANLKKSSVKLFVAPDGRLARFLVESQLGFETKGQELEIRFSSDTTLSGFDAVEDKMPAEAKEALSKDPPPEEPKKD